MISLVFLVCTLDGCSTVTPPNVFPDMESCQMVAITMIEDNKNAMERGELPEHSAIYKCYEWGDPT